MGGPIDKIYVLLYGKPAGQLVSNPETRKLSFQYLKSYLNDEHPIPISMSLPLQTEPIVETYGGLHSYFLNLMPEGWTKQIADEYDLGFTDDLFALLKLQVPLGAIHFQTDFENDFKNNFNTIANINLDEALVEISPAEDELPTPKLLTCMSCGKDLIKPGYNQNLHDHCSRQFFGSTLAPAVAADWASITERVKKQLEQGIVLTGVQPKFSAKLHRSTIRAEIDSDYFIVKPEPKDPFYKDMTRLEASVTQFAKELGLRVCECLQFFLRDGTPAYITKRFDLIKTSGQTEVLHMEDAAQALGVPPTSKYLKGSHEKIGKLIRDNPSIPNSVRYRLLLEYFQITLYNFIMANADAHLKNHSFFQLGAEQIDKLTLKHPLLWAISPDLKNKGINPHEIFKGKLPYVSITTPYYDLFPARLYPSGDTDDLGLTISGKTSGLTRKHFEELAEYLGLKKNHVAIALTSLPKKINSGKSSLQFLCNKNGVSEQNTDKLIQYIDNKLAVLAK